MRIFRGFMLSLVVLLLVAVDVSRAQVLEKKGLSLAAAKKVVAAAVAEAKRLNAPGGVIAVVDDGGHLMYLERLDDTFPAGANISIGKARTAALFKRPTRAFEEIIKNGRTSMVALADFTPLQGGVPLELGGKILGGIGVSGAASAQQDEEIAIAGANAAKLLDTASTSAAGGSISYLRSEAVAAAFAKGAPLLEVEGYKVHASRREAPGMAEIHLTDTDIVYVLEGAATLVTGGTVVDGKTTAPGEIRGASIKGGQAQRLVKGDVIVVPNGVPHWFQEVQGPVLYYVVKVTSGAASSVPTTTGGGQ
jgi:glc operon protein GlcG